MIENLTRQLQVSSGCSVSSVEMSLQEAEAHVGLRHAAEAEAAFAAKGEEATALRELAAEVTDAVARLAAHMSAHRQRSRSTAHVMQEALQAMAERQAKVFHELEERVALVGSQVDSLEENVISEQEYSLQALQTILKVAKNI